MTPTEVQLLAEWLECSPALVTDELVDALLTIQDDPELLSFYLLDFLSPDDFDDEEAWFAPHTVLCPKLELSREEMLAVPTPVIALIWQLECDKLLLKLGCYERRVPICLQP